MRNCSCLVTTSFKRTMAYYVSSVCISGFLLGVIFFSVLFLQSRELNPRSHTCWAPYLHQWALESNGTVIQCAPLWGLIYLLSYGCPFAIAGRRGGASSGNFLLPWAGNDFGHFHSHPTGKIPLWLLSVVGFWEVQSPVFAKEC